MKGLIGRLRAAFSMPVLFTLLLAASLLLMLKNDSTPSRTATQLEARISETLSHIEGAGRVEVVIRTRTLSQTQNTGFAGSTKNEEVPCGAVAVAQGAENPVVRMKLTQALCALLGLQAADVDVLGMSEGGINDGW